MFFPGSRYEKTGQYQVMDSRGVPISVAKLPLPSPRPLLGYHRKLQGQRLDLIASHYLKDPTAFWQLCDANNAMVPAALAARELIGIPVRR